MIEKTSRFLSVVALLLVLVLIFFIAPEAQANGGAPNLAYIAGGGKGISIIDVAQQKVSDVIEIPGNPQTILLSLDGRFLYVTQPQAGLFTVVGTREKNIICSVEIPGEPSLLALDVNTNQVFVAGNKAPGVREIDPDNCAIKRTFQTEEPVYGLGLAVVASSLSQDTGNQLWVASGEKLVVFDSLKGNQIGNIDIPGGAGYVSAPPGATIYVTTRDGKIVAVDLNTHKVITLFSDGKFGPMDYDALTGAIFVPDLANQRVVVLSPVNAGFPPPKQPSRILEIGVQPESIAITNDGRLGFVALSAGDVAMFDIPGRLLISTIHVGGAPRFIITGPYPPTIGTTPEQTSIWTTILNIGAYVLVIALLIIPIFLFRKYALPGNKGRAGKNENSATIQKEEEEAQKKP